MHLSYMKNKVLSRNISSLAKRRSYKHFIPSTKEWSNSIYDYNNNIIKFLPEINNSIYKTLKSFFNMFPKRNELDLIHIKKKQLSWKLLTKQYIAIKKKSKELLYNNRFSMLKTFISKPEIKYTINNVKITIFTYNRINTYIINTIQNCFDLYRKNLNKKKDIKLSKQTVKFIAKKKNEKNKNRLMKNSDAKYHYISSNGNITRIKLPTPIKEKEKFLNKRKRHLIKLKVKKQIYNKKKDVLFFLKNKSVYCFNFYIKRNLKNKLFKKLNLNIFFYSQLLHNKLQVNNYSGIHNYRYKDIHKVLMYPILINLKSTYTQTPLLFNKYKLYKIKSFLLLYKNILNKKPEKKYLKVLITNLNFIIKKKKLNIISYLYKNIKKVFYFKHKLYLYFFNCFKYNNNYLLNIKNFFYMILNKKIEFNIISLKYLHLDSNILANIISTKLIDRNKKILKVLTKSIRLIRKPKFKISYKIKEYNIESNYNYYKWKKNLIFSKKLQYNFKKNKSLQNKILNRHILFRSHKFKNYVFLTGLKNKWIIGTRLQGKGRITKRLTALRSMSKIKYMGTLKNTISSYKGISAYVSKGFAKSNLQYTNINNYSANGAFGVKVSICSL